MPRLLTKLPRYAALALVLLTACGRDGNGDDAQPPPSSAPVLGLQLSESQITVMQGGSGHTVQVRTNGVSGAMLGVAQSSPHRLTAVFAAVSDSEQSLTLSAPADMPAGLYTVYVKGVAGEATGAAEMTVNVSKSPLVTVTGTLRGTHGARVSGASVKATGFNNVQVAGTASAEGVFTLSPVLPPYTLTVTLPGGETHTFVGLTRVDPTLRLLTGAGEALTPVSISGSLSGGAGYPNPATVLTQVVYTSAQGNLGGAGLLGGQGPSYTLFTQQVNEATASGTLDALQWEAVNTNTSSVPVKYRGYARSGPFAGAGQTLTGKDLMLAPVGQSVLSGTIQGTAGMTVTARGLGVHLNARGGFALALDRSTGANFTYPVPVTEAFKGRYVLSLSASHAASGGSVVVNRAHLDAAQTVTFALHTPPVLTLPANGSTGAVTSLHWNAGTLPAPVYIVRYQASGAPNQFVYTAQTAYPVSLKPGTAYTWNLLAYAGLGTTDALSAPELWPAGYPALNGDTDVEAGATPQWSFTSAP